MKKILTAVIAVSLILALSVQAFATTSVSSADTEKIWLSEDGYSYPLTPSDSSWADLSYSEQLIICDMPVDMLLQCSTEELADLVLKYPLLGDILAFDNPHLAMEHLRNTSNICKEFFSRDDIVDVMLETYDELTVDYDGLVTSSRDTIAADCGYISELFLQTYFASVYDSLTETQLTTLTDVIEDKIIAKKGICDDFATSLLMYEWIQADDDVIPGYLVTAEIELELSNAGTVSHNTTFEIDNDGSRSASGFTSKDSLVQFSNTLGIYTVGEYTLYGVTTDCYRFYSNDYTTSEATVLNNYFDGLHPSWTRVSTCTKKYNCHSYTWISSSASNIYWLNNPDAFTGSGAFTCVGYNFNSTPTAGSKIVIGSSMSFDDGFGNVTYSVHSANVVSSSGSTKSKLGAYGVYLIPVDELMRFYDGFVYCIYQ